MSATDPKGTFDFGCQIRSIMYLFRLLNVLLPLFLGGLALADMAAKDYVEVPWRATSYSAVLPAPFQSVTVSLNGEKGAPQDLEIEVNGQSITIDQGWLKDLAQMRIDSISYADPTKTESKTVEYFEVLVVFGESYKVGFEPCDDPKNYGWEKDIALFRIDKTLTASKKIISFRTLDQCGG